MRNKVVILCVTVLLLLIGFNGTVNSQPPDLAGKTDDDTISIAFEYITAYPGTETWLTVWMSNSVSISGFRLVFQMAGFDVARFSCDDTGACIVDTTACSASIFSYFSCQCGNGALIVASGNPGELIPPSPNYHCLFRIRMDVCCIPDADTGRSAYIVLQPGFSQVLDEHGYSLPLSYHMGELFVWWSVPGDANGDSLVSIADVVFLVNYLFMGGPEPCVCEAADCNNDGAINSADIVYLINYLFANGPPPVRGSAYCSHEDCWP